MLQKSVGDDDDEGFLHPICQSSEHDGDGGGGESAVVSRPKNEVSCFIGRNGGPSHTAFARDIAPSRLSHLRKIIIAPLDFMTCLPGRTLAYFSMK